MIRYVSNGDYARRIQTIRPVSSVLSWIVNLDAKYRERNALSKLTDAQLRDIGLNRMDVAKEIDAPFWDPPTQLR